MRRGFKSWCERVSIEHRQALDIPVTTALDPRTLADYLGVRVLMPEDVLGVSANSLRQLTVIDQACWSAVTILQSGVTLVILNSAHPRTRQANSLAHELAHVILNHTSDDAKVSLEGFLFRARFDKEQEDEANWLAGCLLVPREGLLQADWLTPNPAELAKRFGVSTDLVNWRLKVTGIMRQGKRVATIRRLRSSA